MNIFDKKNNTIIEVKKNNLGSFDGIKFDNGVIYTKEDYYFLIKNITHGKLYAIVDGNSVPLKIKNIEGIFSLHAEDEDKYPDILNQLPRF